MNDAAPAEERLALITQLEQKYPGFTEVFYQKGKLLAVSGNRDEALKVWSEALQSADDADVKTRLLADMALLTENKEEKLKIVAQGKDIENGNLVATAMCQYLWVQLEDELKN